MTDQELFNKVATHLLTQNEKAEDPATNSGCKYKIEVNGKVLRCAIGILIPDQKYFPEMETFSISSSTIQQITGLTRDQVGTIHVRGLAGCLQRLHDIMPVEKWKEELGKTAKQFNLEMPTIEIGQ